MDVRGTLECIEKMPYSKAIMLRAKHGVGKSSLIRQYAESQGMILHDVRLSQCEVGDVKGYPNPNFEKKIMEFFKAYWWPRDPNSKGIILFDELNRALRDVMQSVFEVCLDRRLDGEYLPNGWRVISCINAESIYQTTPMDFAMEDRWFMIDFEPTVQDFLDWGVKNQVHNSILKYIELHDEQLDPPMINMIPGKVYPSRRSWASLSETIDALKLFERKDDNGFFTEVASGWVGPIAGPAFVKWALSSNFIHPKDILLNYDEVRKQVEDSLEEIELIASLSNGVVKEINNLTITKDNKDIVLGNLKEFFMALPSDVAASFWDETRKSTKSKKLTLSWENDLEIRDRLDKVFVGILNE